MILLWFFADLVLYSLFAWIFLMWEDDSTQKMIFSIWKNAEIVFGSIDRCVLNIMTSARYGLFASSVIQSAADVRVNTEKKQLPYDNASQCSK